MIPKGWKEYELAELCRKPIQYGIVQTGDHIPGGVPCLRVADFAEGAFDPKKMIRTSVDISNAYARTVLELGDLVVALRGNIGEPRPIPDFLVGTNITRGVARLSPNEKLVSSRFLFWAIQSPSARLEFNRRANGSALQEIPIGPLRTVPLLIPEASEQTAISSYLDSCEQSIGFLRELIIAKMRLRQGLLQQLLTGKRRFPGFTKPWSTTPIGSHFKKSQVAVKWDDNTEYALLSVRRRCGGVFLRQKSFGRDILVKKTFQVSTGDILVSIKQVAHGAIAIVTPEFDGCHVSDSYVVFRPKDHGRISADFLSWTLKTPRFLHLATKSSHGVHIEKMFFDPVYFLRQQISFPADLEEQRRITETLQAADSEITLLERLLAAYQRQKRGLMQQLLTGKRRVRVPAATGEQR